MAKVGLYTVFDRVACECGPILPCKNDGVAYRAYKGTVAKMMTDPAEIQLIQIADFDSDTGQCFPVWPVRLVTAPVSLEEAQHE